MDNEITAIHERNKRVEADKAWETSWTRRLFIASLTYIAAAAFMYLNNLNGAAVQALIPPGAYLLSTLTLPPLKRAWLSRQR